MGRSRPRERDLDRRRALLVAALGFLHVDPNAREIAILHRWLNGWRGVGHIVDGMGRQGCTVSLRNRGVNGGWVASFHRDPVTSADGFASGGTPWEAVQRAAWLAMKDSSPTNRA